NIAENIKNSDDEPMDIDEGSNQNEDNQSTDEGEQLDLNENAGQLGEERSPKEEDATLSEEEEVRLRAEEEAKLKAEEEDRLRAEEEEDRLKAAAAEEEAMLKAEEEQDNMYLAVTAKRKKQNIAADLFQQLLASRISRHTCIERLGEYGLYWHRPANCVPASASSCREEINWALVLRA
ncbi:hypothetical protein AVEN_112246-2-1, partial [Araneus ventricosus]